MTALKRAVSLWPVVLLAVSAAAQAGSFTHWKTTCTLDGQEFELLLNGPSKAGTAKERQVGYPEIFVKQGNSTQRVKFDPPQDALFISPAGKGASLCQGTMAFQGEGSQVAFLLKLNDQPNPDNMAVVLYDVKAAKLLDIFRSDAFGKTQLSHSGINYANTGYFCDEPPQSITINGQTSSTTIKGLQPWYEISAHGGKVESALSRELTYERSLWKPYFKTRDEFEKAFVIIPDGKDYAYHWAYVATHFPGNKQSCILPARAWNMDKEPLHWICVAGVGHP